MEKGIQLIREQSQKLLQRDLVAIRQILVNEMPKMTPFTTVGSAISTKKVHLTIHRQ